MLGTHQYYSNSFSEHKFPEKSNSLDLYEQKEEVIALARILYKEIRTRIATNVLLKFHNFFFVPMYAYSSPPVDDPLMTREIGKAICGERCRARLRPFQTNNSRNCSRWSLTR